MGEAYSRIKQSACHSIKHPDVDGQGGSERSSNVHQRKGEERCVGVAWRVVVDGGLGAYIRHEEEHEGSAELAEDDDELVADRVSRSRGSMHYGQVYICLIIAWMMLRRILRCRTWLKGSI